MFKFKKNRLNLAHGETKMGGKLPKTSLPNKPLVSIITPCLNSEKYIEQTIQSVLSQTYQNIEYIIVDGGSTDKTLDIVRKYEDRIARWISEPDKGMYDALNKGFAKSTGEIMVWLNSDDMFTPWALNTAVDIFQSLSSVEWITSLFPILWNARGKATACFELEGFNQRAFRRGRNLPGRGFFGKTWIQQESTFWKRSIWEKAGGFIDSSFKLAGDFELWNRFFDHNTLFGVSVPLGGFRCHADQKTYTQKDAYLKEAEKVLHLSGKNPFTFFEVLIRGLTLGLHENMRKPFQFLSYPTQKIHYALKEDKWVIYNDYFY